MRRPLGISSVFSRRIRPACSSSWRQRWTCPTDLPTLAARVLSEGQQWSLYQAQFLTITVTTALAVELRSGSARISSSPGSLGSAAAHLPARVATGEVFRVVEGVMSDPPPPQRRSE